MKFLVNYADNKYNPSRRWNTRTGKCIAGFNSVIEFGPQDIDASFRNANSLAFGEQRGNGLWLWKPYIINKVMETAKDGDIIFYCDSGAFFIRKMDKIFSSMDWQHPLWVCDIPLIESCFTKPSAFTIMGCEGEDYRKSNQIIATYLGIYVCDKSRAFIKEWLDYCCNFELLKPEGTLNISEKKGDSFVVHREDQSIFSLLCKKHGIHAHRDISQRGLNPQSYYNPNYEFIIPNHPDDKYGNLIYLHKSPKLSLYVLLKPMLKRLYHNLSLFFNFLK